MLNLQELPIVSLSLLHRFADFGKKMLDIHFKIGHFMDVLIAMDIWHIGYFYYVQIIWSLAIPPGNIYH
jgi:hypothetical protein